MIEKVKTLLNIGTTDKDALLILLIEQAIDEAIAYTNNEQIASLAESAIIKMVVYNYNRIGTEGLSSEGYSGVSFNYDTSYPEVVLHNLNKYRKVIMA